MGLRPRPCWLGELTALPHTSYLDLRGSTSKGRGIPEGEEEREGKAGDGEKGREGKGGKEGIGGTRRVYL